MQRFCRLIIFGLLGLIWISNSSVFAQTTVKPVFLNGPEPAWVKEKLKSMSLEEKVGQLFFVAAYSNKDDKHRDEITQLIKNQKIGGLIFFQGGPVRQLKLTKYFQEVSKIPLMIAMDAEWGPAMRLDSVVAWPYQMQLGAGENEELVYQMGESVAAQLKRLGVQLNFAPVVDVNSNPDNPVINHRSFGEDLLKVNRFAIAYMKGMQDHKVLAVAKHFPGHGDTHTDSHSELPVIQKTKAEIMAGEGIPYRKLMDQGLSSVMVAHILLPKLDPLNPASLSKKKVHDFLKQEYGFEGLCFTDALNMKGAKMKNDKPVDVEIRALLAGEDVLVMSENVKEAIVAIVLAVRSGKISEDQINQSCRKVLRAKYFTGLSSYKVPETVHLVEDLANPRYEVLNEQLRHQSITIVHNESMIPYRNLSQFAPIIFYMGSDGDEFIRMVHKYKTCKFIKLTEAPNAPRKAELFQLIEPQNHIIIVAESGTQSPVKKFGLTDSTVQFINELAAQKPSSLVILGNAYMLNLFDSLKAFKSIIVAYDKSIHSQKAAAQVLFGGLKAKGRLPVSIKKHQLQAGDGLVSYAQTRLGYALPESVGLNADTLQSIEMLANELIDSLAAPGCQILVAKDGMVVYEKAFGYYDYQKKKPVSTESLYDLASVTKILAVTPLLMHFQEENVFHLQDSLSVYLPETDTTNKGGLKCLDILTHQAGLVPWIAFYKLFAAEDSLAKLVFSSHPDSLFTIQIHDSMYMNYQYRDSLYARIYASDTLKKTYKYSDLGYFLFQKWMESYTGKSLNKLGDSLFYSSLGADRLTYLPLEKFSLEELVPTENDTVFRHQLVHGRVHDPGTAMLGGVGGHAGLFGNAGSVVKMLQLLLWEGNYGDERYLEQATIRQYTSAPFISQGNRRGIGFDKTDRMTPANSPACPQASSTSYGHSGFTGTLVWVDPQYQLIYIFLSNRVHPDASNKKLVEKSYRTRIQEKIYHAIQ